MIQPESLHAPIRYIEESAYGEQVSLCGRDPEMMAKFIDPFVNQVSRVNLNSQCRRGPDVFPITGRKDALVGSLSVSDVQHKGHSCRQGVRSQQAAHKRHHQGTPVELFVDGFYSLNG